MNELELKAIVQAEIGSAMGYLSGELSTERAKAMDYYLGEPFGNEMDGRSQVVSRDTAETIEWILPSLIRIFTSGDQAVEFEAVSPEDEAMAKQETEYCNYIFYRRNEGFLILYTWFKDALLQKNGIVKSFCDKKEETTREEYQGLTDDEFAILLNDPELDPKEHTERMYTGEIPGPEGLVRVDYRVHDVVFKRTKTSHDITVVNIPPEEFLISRKANSPNPKKAPFAAHRSKKTLSELREMGFDKKKLDRIPSSSTEVDTEAESLARRHLSDEDPLDTGHHDPAMREVWVYECYIKVDYDADGIAELRKVTLAGNEILENEEADKAYFSSLTPIILTHKFFGLSVADLVNDLQLIKSTIWRQILDNLYLNNNAMMGADVNTVNLDDLLSRRPGGAVRTIGPPSQALMPIINPPVPPEAFSMIEYIDTVKETRTGVGRQFQGLNADVLKEANIPAVQGLLSAAQQRVEMIARIFAETGVKQLFMDLHELIRKYPNKPEVVKLTNNWVPVDPREWRERKNMTVSVGLGSASKDQQLLAINSVIQDQTLAVQGGGMGMIVNWENIHNALKKKAEINGFKSPDMFWMDPKTAQPPPPPPPDPQILAIQAQTQIEGEKRKIDQAKMQLEGQLKTAQMQFEAQESMRQFEIEQIRLQIESLKVQQKAQADDQKHVVEIRNNDVNAQLQALQLALDEKQSQRDAAIEKYKADLSARMEAFMTQFQHQSQLMNTELQARHKEALQMNANSLAGAKNDMKSHMDKMAKELVDTVVSRFDEELSKPTEVSLETPTGKRVSGKVTRKRKR